MIARGECGAINPLLLDCLSDISDQVEKVFLNRGQVLSQQQELRNISQVISQHQELSASHRTLQLLEHERVKYNFFAAMSQEIQFEYTILPPMVTLNTWGAERLGVSEVIIDPCRNSGSQLFRKEDWADFAKNLRCTTPEQPLIVQQVKLMFQGEHRWFQVTARTIWSNDEPAQYTGVIGKMVDVQESRSRIESLQQMANHDSLTGLLNLSSARKCIEELLAQDTRKNYALAVFDLDWFKQANDTYGHSFGNEVLIWVAEKVRQSVRTGDVVARFGGDEFLIFLEYSQDIDFTISRIFRNLSGINYKGFLISSSMGVAQSSVAGIDFDALFRAADTALYEAKNAGRGTFSIYKPIETQ